jgi:carbonic anhydrase
MRHTACAALAAAALSCAPSPDRTADTAHQRTTHSSYKGEDGPARWAEDA